MGLYHLGIDSTDSPKGGCTTWTFVRVVHKLFQEDHTITFSGYPRLIRLNPNIVAEAENQKVEAWHKQSKFGISLNHFDKLREIVNKYKISINGIHLHSSHVIMSKDVFLCKECHKEHGLQYPQSAHANSLSESKTLNAFRNYIKFTADSDSNTGAALRDDCFTCHSPRVKNASDDLLE